MRKGICHTRCHHGRVVNGKYVAKVYEVGESANFREGEVVPPHFDIVQGGPPKADPLADLDPDKPLKKYGIDELRGFAQALNVPDWDKMSKPQLVEAVGEATADVARTAPEDE